MVLPVNGSTHLIPAYFSFIDPERMKGWIGVVVWPVADGLPTLVVTHQLQVERRTGKVRQSETDVLPLCHATNGSHLGSPGKTAVKRVFVCVYIINKYQTAVDQFWLTDQQTDAVSDWLTADHVRHFAATAFLCCGSCVQWGIFYIADVNSLLFVN